MESEGEILGNKKLFTLVCQVETLSAAQLRDEKHKSSQGLKEMSHSKQSLQTKIMNI